MSNLLIFDRLNAPPPASVVVPPPDPGPLVTAKEPMVAEPAAKDAAKAPSEEANKSAAPLARVEESVPEGTGAPRTVPLQPRPGEKPLTKPATSQLAALHPAGSSPAVASRSEPARELARSKPSPSALAVTQTAPEPEPQAASRPLTQAAARNFGLQLGVFSNLANAEELRARLLQNGIPRPSRRGCTPARSHRAPKQIWPAPS